MKNFSSVSEFINAVTNNGLFGTTIIAVTEPEMRKTNNKYYGRVRKATYLTNVQLGGNYESIVGTRIERVGGNAKDWKTEKPKGKTWQKFPYILVADDDPNKCYLRTTMRKNTATKVVYLLDGIIVDDEQTLAEIKSFIPTSTASAKQASFGLTAENEVIVRDYTLENIQCITHNGMSYTNGMGNLLINFFK